MKSLFIFRVYNTSIIWWSSNKGSNIHFDFVIVGGGRVRSEGSQGGCEPRIEVIVKKPKKKIQRGGGVGQGFFKYSPDNLLIVLYNLIKVSSLHL